MRRKKLSCFSRKIQPWEFRKKEITKKRYDDGICQLCDNPRDSGFKRCKPCRVETAKKRDEFNLEIEIKPVEIEQDLYAKVQALKKKRWLIGKVQNALTPQTISERLKITDYYYQRGFV